MSIIGSLANSSSETLETSKVARSESPASVGGARKRSFTERVGQSAFEQALAESKKDREPPKEAGYQVSQALPLRNAPLETSALRSGSYGAGKAVAVSPPSAASTNGQDERVSARNSRRQEQPSRTRAASGAGTESAKDTKPSATTANARGSVEGEGATGDSSDPAQDAKGASQDGTKAVDGTGGAGSSSGPSSSSGASSAADGTSGASSLENASTSGDSGEQSSPEDAGGEVDITALEADVDVNVTFEIKKKSASAVKGDGSSSVPSASSVSASSSTSASPGIAAPQGTLVQTWGQQGFARSTQMHKDASAVSPEIDINSLVDQISKARGTMSGGTMSASHARVVIGEGAERVALTVRLHNGIVNLEARAADPAMAHSLERSSSELSAALSKHGLSLGNMETGSGGTNNFDHEANGAGDGRGVSHENAASDPDPDPGVMALRRGVRIVA